MQQKNNQTKPENSSKKIIVNSFLGENEIQELDNPIKCQTPLSA